MAMANPNEQIVGGLGVMGGMGPAPTPGIANAQMAGPSTPSSMSPKKGGGHSLGSAFVDLVHHLLGPGDAVGQALTAEKKSLTGKGRASVPRAGGTAPPAGPQAAPISSTTTGAKPLIDPMALHLFFSQIIGPYLDKIVGEQNAAADQLGAQMNHALSNFSLPPEARALLEARIPQEQQDIRDVAQSQRAAVASAPDLAAFMQTVQNATKEQEMARLEQARVLAAQNTGTTGGAGITPEQIALLTGG